MDRQAAAQIRLNLVRPEQRTGWWRGFAPAQRARPGSTSSRGSQVWPRGTARPGRQPSCASWTRAASSSPNISTGASNCAPTPTDHPLPRSGRHRDPRGRPLGTAAPFEPGDLNALDPIVARPAAPAGGGDAAVEGPDSNRSNRCDTGAGFNSKGNVVYLPRREHAGQCVATGAFASLTRADCTPLPRPALSFPLPGLPDCQRETEHVANDRMYKEAEDVVVKSDSFHSERRKFGVNSITLLQPHTVVGELEMEEECLP